ncbi:MAG: Rrf2 family transcriptional regulator [Lachnospiraceae bacterium]|nr:Rrf2 family transcriptional regulator [Lachnospiraceae bacterium]MCR5701701.1 Rrf2 family transcriptional regulator [Lachnospiraceae bacterium]
MKISTRGRYALIIMLDLATYNTGEPIRLKDIAKRQLISEKYLEQIIAMLNKAGYVKSIRGPQGGYLLKNSPEEYTVGMILRQTEGDLSPVSYEDEESYQRETIISKVWVQIEEAINDIVDNITLRNLIDWQEEEFYNYVI